MASVKPLSVLALLKGEEEVMLMSPKTEDTEDAEDTVVVAGTDTFELFMDFVFVKKDSMGVTVLLLTFAFSDEAAELKSLLKVYDFVFVAEGVVGIEIKVSLVVEE